MKKIIISITILAGLQLGACVKLDRQPTDGYSTDQYFTNRQAAEDNLAAVYQLTKMSGFFEDGNSILLDDITDNAYCPFTNQMPSYIALGTATPTLISGTYVDLYRTYFSYQGIKTANYFLENIDKVASITDEEKTGMKAEARFLRAFNYARKLMFFGGVPLITKTLAYGEENNYPRNSEKEVADFVLTELEQITGDLPITSDGPLYGHITRGAALALEARLALFIGDYARTEAACQKILDLGIYDLYNNYEGLFWEVNQSDPLRNKEVLLEVTYKAPTWASWIDALYTVEEGGWNSVNPTQSLVDAYETKNGLPITEDPSYDPNHPYDNRDPRLYASVIYPGIHWNGRIFNSLEPVGPDEYYNSSKGNRSRTGYGLRKYCAPLDQLPNHDPADGQGLNFIVFRYPEVLLSYAEALIEQNKDLGKAAGFISQVRHRVGMPEVKVGSQAALRKVLRNERRVEFAFEGLRWYDLKRWKIAEEVMNGPVYGVRPGKVDMTTGAVTFSSPDHITVGAERKFNPQRDYYFPIPEEDLDANEALKGHQNPNW